MRATLQLDGEAVAALLSYFDSRVDRLARRYAASRRGLTRDHDGSRRFCDKMLALEVLEIRQLVELLASGGAAAVEAWKGSAPWTAPADGEPINLQDLAGYDAAGEREDVFRQVVARVWSDPGRV